FYPWAAYDGTGRLQIGFFDRSYDRTSKFGTSFKGNHLYGYTLASETTPGSLSFTYQQVSTALSDPTNHNAWFRPNINANFPAGKLFIGDYSNIAILGNGGVGARRTDLRDTFVHTGRTGFTEESFFGDPVPGSSSSALALSASPPAVTSHASQASLLSRDS